MPGHKAAKDGLTLLFGGNASGNMKFNPLLIYHPENPRTLKNIAKGSLPVVWMSNPKAWAVVQSLSPVCLFVTLWTVAYQVPLSMGFPRQGYWSGLPFPSPGALPGPGIEPTSPALAGAYPTEPLGKPKNLGFTDHIPGLVFPRLYPRGREIVPGEGYPIQQSFATRQYSGPPPIHGQLSPQHQSSAYATKYYVTHRTH